MLILPPLLSQFFVSNAAAQTGQPQQQNKRKYPAEVPVVKTLPTLEKTMIARKLPDGVVIELARTVSMKKFLTVYDNLDFSGASKSLGAGSYDRKSLGDLNDRISSMSAVVNEGFTIQMCDADGTQPGGSFGECWVIDYKALSAGLRRDSLRELTYGFDNRASFIKITEIEPSLVVYDLPNQRGKSKRFEGGFNSGAVFGILYGAGDEFENRISSIKVGNGYRATLCKSAGDNPPSPNCEIFEAGRHNVRLNNAHSKINIYKF